MSDLDQIRNLKARYVRLVDAKSWTTLVSLFTPSARFDGLAQPTASAEEFVAGVAAFFEGVESVHQVHSPEFAWLPGDRVRGVWGLQDLLTWAPGVKAYRGVHVAEQWGLLGFGYYEEEYVKIDGRWLIDFLRATRLRVIPLVGSVPPPIAYPVLSPTPRWLEGG